MNIYTAGTIFFAPISLLQHVLPHCGKSNSAWLQISDRTMYCRSMSKDVGRNFLGGELQGRALAIFCWPGGGLYLNVWLLNGQNETIFLARITQSLLYHYWWWLHRYCICRLDAQWNTFIVSQTRKHLLGASIRDRSHATVRYYIFFSGSLLW